MRAGMWQALLTSSECLRGTLERRKEREEGRRHHWSLVLEAASCQGRNSASETTPSHPNSQMLMNSLESMLDVSLLLRILECDSLCHIIQKIIHQHLHNINNGQIDINTNIYIKDAL